MIGGKRMARRHKRDKVIPHWRLRMEVLAACFVICSLVFTMFTNCNSGGINGGLPNGRLSVLESFVEKNERPGEDIDHEFRAMTDLPKNTLAVLPNKSPYAYSWLVGGIHEDRYSHKGFLYTIAIAANILRKKGSEADFVLWAQLAPDSKLIGRIPAEDERLLRLVGVQVRMLDTVEKDSFTQIVYEKFRVLSMTEYQRVIFLDGDIMPRSNMDYIFHLSRKGVLRPNLILATRGEPCNTAMFMVTPSESNWERMQSIIKRRHDEVAKMPHPHFDFNIGWGWNFMENDTPWEAIDKKGWKWRYHAGHSDQGLMYYYSKFAIQDTSIVIGHRLQNWIPGDGKPKKILESEFLAEIKNKTLLDMLPPNESRINFNCNGARKRGDAGWWVCEDLPYKHFVHFSGNDKPWQHGLIPGTKKPLWYGVAGDWFNELGELNDKVNLGLDIKNWTTKHAELMGESTFGYIAKYGHLKDIIISHNKTETVNQPTDGATIDVASRI
mmetsp:Transcript_54136/g.61230  ORF Transcript_54136/g.61230 Transcript_54136/m.61230 type:complete len:496 (+) Transcript_54136:96-1583(+)